MYFTASAVYLLQRYVQTSEIHKVYFDVFHSECSVSSTKIRKSGVYLGVNGHFEGERNDKRAFSVTLFLVAERV